MTPVTAGEGVDLSINRDFVIVSISGNEKSVVEVYDRSGNFVEMIEDDLAEIAFATMAAGEKFYYLRQPDDGVGPATFVPYEADKPIAYVEWLDDPDLAESYQVRRDYLERGGGNLCFGMTKGGELELSFEGLASHAFDIDLEWSLDIENWSSIGLIDAKGEVSLSRAFTIDEGRVQRVVPSSQGYFRIPIASGE